MLDPHSKQASNSERKDHDSQLKQVNSESLDHVKPIKLHPNLSIYYGSILDIKDCNCIVNAANEALTGGGGIDYIIHQQSGKELGEYCKTHYPIIEQPEGRCLTGNSVLTPAFKLKNFEFIIHTVGPYLDKQNKPQPRLLASCYTTAISLALQNNIKSIVFPCISTGFYGYPMLEAANVAINTINDILEQNDKNERTINKIRVILAVYNDLEQQIFKKLTNTT